LLAVCGSIASRFNGRKKTQKLNGDKKLIKPAMKRQHSQHRPQTGRILFFADEPETQGDE